MSRSLTLVFDRRHPDLAELYDPVPPASRLYEIRVDCDGLASHLWGMYTCGTLPTSPFKDGLDDPTQKGVVHDDTYGMPLRSIAAADLARAIESYPGLAGWDRAILAFLVAGPGCPVILYWS